MEKSAGDMETNMVHSPDREDQTPKIGQQEWGISVTEKTYDIVLQTWERYISNQGILHHRSKVFSVDKFVFQKSDVGQKRKQNHKAHEKNRNLLGGNGFLHPDPSHVRNLTSS